MGDAMILLKEASKGVTDVDMLAITCGEGWLLC